MKAIVILLVSFFAINVSAQIKTNKKKEYIYFEATGRYGKILGHAKEENSIYSNPFQALELRVGKQTYGNDNWSKSFNYPTYGVGAYISSFHAKEIGNPKAVFGFIDFPVWRRYDLDKLDISLGLGLSFGFNKFNEKYNPLNRSIGSYVNSYFDLGIRYNLMLGKRWAIKPGINFAHFSNSSTVQPNLGLNMVDVSLALQYKLYVEKPNKLDDIRAEKFPKELEFIHEKAKLPISNKNYMHMRIAGGIRQNTFTGNKFYNIALYSIGYTHVVNNTYKVGLGIDFMYDSSIEQEYFTYHGLDSPKQSNYTSGINVSNSLVVDNVELNLQIGYYIYRKYPLQYNVYIRPGIKLYLTKRFYSMVSFKVENFSMAQYIEWGIGIDFL